MAAYHTSSPSGRFSGMRLRAFLLPAILLFILACFLFSPLPRQYDENRDAIVQHITDSAKDHLSVVHTPEPAPSKATPEPAADKATSKDLANVKSKFAFATFLAGTNDVRPYDEDHYFIATRILAYQLLHAPETRSRDAEIPFLVLVTEKVTEEQRQRLREDGAVVVVAPYLRADWINAAIEGWQDVMTKLRLWELTQFDRICFLDGDTQLISPLDGIFSDPAVAEQYTGNKTAKVKDDEAKMPSTFVFAGVPEMLQKHTYPPTEENHSFPNYGYLNAGFFVLQPSTALLEYYKSLINIPDRFNSEMPEQNLLNYAHRPDGNMPWKHLANTWNIHYPTMADVEGGVASIHEKWWSPDPSLSGLMWAWRWRMEGFYERDSAALAKQGKASNKFTA